METTQAKQLIGDRLHAKIRGAGTGRMLSLSFAEIAQQTGIAADELEPVLRDMCRNDGVMRVGHPDFRADQFTFDKEHREPEQP